MPFISWKLVESRSKDSTERVLVVILISADQPFDKFASRKIYIYICMPRGKKGRRYTRENILQQFLVRCRGRFCCTSCRMHGALTVRLTESDRKSIRLSMKTMGYTAAGISNVGARQLCRARRLARNRFTTLLPRFCTDYESILSLSPHPLRRCIGFVESL